MSTVFREMIKVLEVAEQRGVPPHLVVFSMNLRGMRRYRRASLRVAGANKVLARLTVTCDPTQEPDFALGPLPN